MPARNSNSRLRPAQLQPGIRHGILAAIKRVVIFIILVTATPTIMAQAAQQSAEPPPLVFAAGGLEYGYTGFGYPSWTG
jgi:hypothetical protein